MLTVSQLAKQFGISRTSILYYEREGLLLPRTRSENGYRWYGPEEINRLEKIMAYRSFGVPVAQLSNLIDRSNDACQEKILQDQFNALEWEIQQLRLQQKAILQFMEQPELVEEKVISKERWTQIMSDAGLTDEDQHNWHIHFEQTKPEGHQRFLESLNIKPAEIKSIREWSKP
ncbi:MerR family transcriptional regulator [Amphritea balenae]|uniref:MerR family transcriptional regulator n=1 Tax=Amphritea balenae TaxID=452629 RepID=A0A3P1SXL3_9GAMM|nr:MerR family transcriptional regulator [Amphritea balenae]RRD01725.1 MerR family transcriptional regulator [Amphritea balenae]GGK54646.1 MerR family transcriptional regulator [Amphritea balenae]